MHCTFVEVAVHITSADPVVLAYADRSHLTGLDKSVDRHVGNPHQAGNFANGQKWFPESPLSHIRPISMPEGTSPVQTLSRACDFNSG